MRKIVFSLPLLALLAIAFGHDKAIRTAPLSAMPAQARAVPAQDEFDSMRAAVDDGYFASWADEFDRLPGRTGPLDLSRRTFISTAAPAVFMAGELPPVFGIPVDEVVNPGTLAEATAERAMDYGPKLVKVPEAWAKNPKARGKGVKVAVLDTGCDITHKWIAPNVKGTYNAITKTRDVTDRQNHGTHCTGTVLEALPDCDIYIVKVLGDNGSGSVVDIAHGIDYAVTTWGVDVISLSLGGPSQDSYIPPAFKRGNEAGTLFVVAAGNEGPRDNTDGYPGRYVPPSLSTAACNERGEITNFSSRGASVVTNTPGSMILSALPGNKQGRMSGTSMATPLHAALAGAWCATNDVPKKERPAKYREALRLACSHPNTRNNAEGYGLPDATKLVPADAVVPVPPVCPPVPSPVGSINLGPTDLTPDALARLKAAGITGFQLRLDFGAPVVPVVPAPMPPSDPAPVVPSPVVPGCPGGNCPTAGGYYQSAPVQQWQPFGGIFRRR